MTKPLPLAPKAYLALISFLRECRSKQEAQPDAPPQEYLGEGILGCGPPPLLRPPTPCSAAVIELCVRACVPACVRACVWVKPQRKGLGLATSRGTSTLLLLLMLWFLLLLQKFLLILEKGALVS